MPSIVSLGEYAILWIFLAITLIVVGVMAIFKK